MSDRLRDLISQEKRERFRRATRQDHNRGYIGWVIQGSPQGYDTMLPDPGLVDHAEIGWSGGPRFRYFVEYPKRTVVWNEDPDDDEKFAAENWLYRKGEKDVKHITVREYADMLNEGMNLSPNLDTLCEKLAKYIASSFLYKIKQYASDLSGSPDEHVVKYAEYIRLATQHRNETKGLFKAKKDNELTTWGPAHMRIYTQGGPDFPDTVLRITAGYPQSNGGYVEDVEMPQEIFILVDWVAFVKSYKKSLEELTDTIKHEIRHWIQFNQVTGLPKVKVLNRKTDVLGNYLEPYKGYKSARNPHIQRDIEFKPNVHTYAFYIKRWLNRNVAKPEWKDDFIAMMTGRPLYTGNEDLDSMLDNIEALKKKEPLKWKLFVKELYREIFS